MSFRIVQPGTSMIRVGPPQPTLRRYGIAVGGPADEVSFAYGNALVGNACDTPAWEIALSGPQLRAESDMRFAIIGAAADAWLADQPLATNSSHPIRKGQILRIGKIHKGLRCYLVSSPHLAVSPSQSLGNDWFPHLGIESLRLLPGPQRDWFPEAALQGEYTVSPSSNRMGIRLQGSALKRPSRELISEAISPGAIQITNEGQPILIGIDGQTIGGYPKIAHVISADMPVVGQLQPMQKIDFEWVTQKEAELAWDSLQQTLRTNLMRIRTCQSAS